MIKKKTYMYYVIFDGSTAYAVDFNDCTSILKKDKDTEIIYKSINLNLCFDFADNYNDNL